MNEKRNDTKWSGEEWEHDEWWDEIRESWEFRICLFTKDTIPLAPKFEFGIVIVVFIDLAKWAARTTNINSLSDVNYYKDKDWNCNNYE